VSICYHPHAFDAQHFAAQADTCRTTLDLIMALMDYSVDDPCIGWSIDGTPEGDLISRRVHSDRGSVSLVENVRSAFDPTSPVAGHAEAIRLLGHVSEFDGRLVDEEPFVGYLMPDEIRRVSALLAQIPFPGDPGQEHDLVLLLRLFTTALEDDRGLYWTWA
jgi:hypothetical protein